MAILSLTPQIHYYNIECLLNVLQIVEMYSTVWKRKPPKANQNAFFSTGLGMSFFFSCNLCVSRYFFLLNFMFSKSVYIQYLKYLLFSTPFKITTRQI